ncbi:MAG: helix-turn-helix transcriptional regulator [Treponema sp.]|nr:helix-turn-helix transcriptional regulator [Treponema sp.]
MDYATRSPSLQRLDSDKGKWVNYQIRLRGLTQKEIAARAGCSQSQVANTLAGRTSSSKIYLVLCDILEISSIAELLATPRRSAV